MTKRFIFAVFIAFMMFGCATNVDVTSYRDANYHDKLDRLLIVIRLDKTGINSDYVRQDFLVKFAAREVEVESVVIEPQTLDVTYQNHVAAKFRPRQVMELVPNKAWKNRFGQIINIVMEGRLVDVTTNKIVWRSSIQYWNPVGGSVQQKAGTLADSVIVKLQEDGLL
jgi:hypothetical protein